MATKTALTRLAAIILMLLPLVSSRTSLADDGKYLFAYFKGNGEDGLHLAESTDGYSWRALAGDSAVLAPMVGDKLMRDPCIIAGHDGLYHMVWTVGWDAQSIGYAHSTDLVHWSEQRLLHVMGHEPNVRNCWAPEITYDSATDSYIIYWASSITGKFTETEEPDEANNSHRIYCTTTKDFITLSDPQLLFEPGFSVIDATILPHDGKYLMFAKNETLHPECKYIFMASADKITGPYHITSPRITGNYWCEGPTVLMRDGRVIVYFDKYTEHRYGAVESTDLKTWHDISHKVTFPDGARHGSVIVLP